MLRKTMLAVAAAGALALGVGSATAPAEAGVRVFIGTPGFYVGPGYGYYHHHHYRPHYYYGGCYWKKIKVWSKKKHKYIKVKKRVCY